MFVHNGCTVLICTLYGQTHREERPREEMRREYCYLSEGGPLGTEQAASTVDSLLQYRIYCAGWPALFTMDHLHLCFKSSPASSG
jgi:hypothetical protein